MESAVLHWDDVMSVNVLLSTAFSERVPNLHLVIYLKQGTHGLQNIKTTIYVYTTGKQ